VCPLRSRTSIDATFGDEPFTRVELQLRKERATKAWAMLIVLPLDDWPQRAAGFLRAFIDIEADWWMNWLDGVSRFKLSTRRPPSSVEHIEQWLFHQVTPSLAVWLEARNIGGEVDKFKEDALKLFRDGRSRHSGKHRQMIRSYRQEQHK